MKKIFFIILFFQIQASADLLQEVDQLTPEQAYEFQQRLGAKMLEPIPAGFFTNLSTSITSQVVLSDAKEFKSFIDSRFSSPNKLDKVQSVNMDVLWRLGEGFRLGFEMGFMTASATAELVTNTFQSINLKSLLTMAKVGYKVGLSEDFFLFPYIGLGMANSMANLTTTTDTSFNTSGSTYNVNMSNSAFAYKAGASLNYSFNKLFSIGLDLSILQDKVTKLKREGEREVTNPSELNLSGFGIGVKASVNL